MKRFHAEACEADSAAGGEFKFDSDSDLEFEEIKLPEAPSLRSIFEPHELEEAAKLACKLPCVLAVREHTGLGSPVRIRTGEVFTVDYGKSSPHELFLGRFLGSVRPEDQGQKRRKCAPGGGEVLDAFVPRDAVLPVASPAQDLWHGANREDWLDLGEGSLLAVYDSVWGPLRAPVMALDAGLESFVAPLSAQQFREHIWQKKVFVNMGCGSRLSALLQDFEQFDLKALLQQAVRCTAWMKTIAKPPQVQFIDCSPDIALNCYQSGHTLYFNPSIELQQKYLLPIMMDLGLPASAAEMHSDVEIFAAPCPGVTPWHFDSQHNFTVQLSGAKKWSVKKGPHNPLTNFHVRSTNSPELRRNRIVHGLYDPKLSTHDAAEPPEGEVAEFVLRPGSVMYIPAGMWHQVESISDEPSLSFNFSLHPPSWAELIMQRLTNRLSQDPVCRNAAALTHLGVPDQTPGYVLQALDQLVQELKAVPDIRALVQPSYNLGGAAQEESINATGDAEVDAARFDLADPPDGIPDIRQMLSKSSASSLAEKIRLNPLQHFVILNSSDCGGFVKLPSGVVPSEKDFVIVCHDGLSGGDSAPQTRAVILASQEALQLPDNKDLDQLKLRLQSLARGGARPGDSPLVSGVPIASTIEEILGLGEAGQAAVAILLFVGSLLLSS